MTDDRIRDLLRKGYMPCEIIDQHACGVLRNHLTTGTTLCVVPPETLYVREGKPGFVQLVDDDIIAEWDADEILWVSAHPVTT